MPYHDRSIMPGSGDSLTIREITSAAGISGLSFFIQAVCTIVTKPPHSVGKINTTGVRTYKTLQEAIGRAVFYKGENIAVLRRAHLILPLCK